jgi:hypothetical protein
MSEKTDAEKTPAPAPADAWAGTGVDQPSKTDEAAAKASADAAAKKAADKAKADADALAKAKANAKELPEDVRIPRGNPAVPVVKVYGEIGDVVTDIANNNAIVDVHFVDAKAFTKDGDDQILFIEGPNSVEIVSASRADGKFGVKADGSVVYSQRGLGESADWELVHIAKLLKNKK